MTSKLHGGNFECLENQRNETRFSMRGCDMAINLNGEKIYIP